MRYFLEEGCECSLVDHCEEAIPGVAKIATSEGDIPEGASFDVIVCSHVIEHVAAPVGVIAALRRHLAPDGIIFVEVPLEIWSRPPIHEEPVTHVNFFSPQSLSRLFYEAGLVSIECCLAASRHPAGIQKVVRGLARLGQDRECPNASVAIREAERFLSPDLLLRLRWRFLAPATLAGAVSRKLKGLPSQRVSTGL
jgi:SAM-dependent methyltransferase